MKIKLLPKFIISLAILGAVLTITISLFSYKSSKTYLESMYAQRITSGSKSVATMLNLEDVRTIISEGGQSSEAYSRVENMLNTLKKDGDITYLSLVIPDENSVTFYIDCCVEEMGDDPYAQLTYGTNVLYKDAAYDEVDLKKYILIWNLYAQNKGTDEPVVTDNSYGYNYTSVSPILDENGNAIAEIQYILDMQDVRNHLNSFLYNMLIISLSSICGALLLYMLFVRKVVINPIERLAIFTTSITSSGEFSKQKIEINTKDEIQELGTSFNIMLEELESYIENLTTVTSEKERISTELNVATHIQLSMLPCIFPAFPDRDEIDIYATMTPAKEVGGDFYDFFMVDERHLAIVVADVSGKGVPAALFMVIGKTLIKDHTQPNRDLGEVFTKVNNILCEANDNGMFITAFEGVLDLVTGEFRYVNAGHEPPFIYRKGVGFEVYKTRPGFVLAGMENIKYKEQKIMLNVGDRIFQYTDGVTEAMNKQEQLYGMDRLNAVLNEKCIESDANETLKLVKNDIDVFVGDNEQFDDITMLCLEYKRKMGDNSMNEITVEATVENISKVTDFVDDILDNVNCPLKVKMQMDIAIDEIFGNIAHYAYGDKVGKATVRIEEYDNPKAIGITFIDSGVAYNPLEKEDPDITLSAEEREIGGLGIYMVKKNMDTMEYEYSQGQNKLLIKKYID